jgi:hypothetical protein
LFHIYFDAWDRWFGPGVHAHGMYQMEFYEHVLRRVSGENVLLSGLVGDWFAGRGDDRLTPVKGPSQVRLLIQEFGMCADSSMSHFTSSGELYAEYYETHRAVLDSWSRRLVELVRFRMMLLHYLTRVPREYGLRPTAPFLDIRVATAMLGLPMERRKDRRWQTEYFAACGAGLEGVTGRSYNTLNLQAMRLVPLQALDEALLREVVRVEYVRWINRNAGWRGPWWDAYGSLLRSPGLAHARPLLKRWGLMPRRLEAYRAYLVLKPIESLLRRRNEARQGMT